MNKLTDLEICKRIAEILGVKFTVISGKIVADAFQVHDLFSCAHMGFIFNPLTDNALCFQLMVKCKITVEFTRYYEHLKSTTTRAYYDHKADNGYGAYIQDVNPNRAICLAKIEAHKEL